MRTLLSPRIRCLLSLFGLFACFLTISQSALRLKVVQAQESPASHKPSGPPSQTPSSSQPGLEPKKRSVLQKVFTFLSCNTAKWTKEQELYRTGQQFPESYDDNNFSIVALVKGGWQVAVEYQAQPGADATITFAVKDVEPFSEILQKDAGPNSPSTSLANPVMAVFRLPERFGVKPQAALISIKAVLHTPNGDIPADFQFVGLGIGDLEPKPTSSNHQPGEMNILKVKASSRGVEVPYDFSSGSRRAYLPIGTVYVVRIASVDVAPSSLTPAGEFEYSFVSNARFGRWSSALHKNTQVPIKGQLISGTVRLPPTAKFNELVSVGRNPAAPLTKRWTIKKGQFTPGEYKIGVSAQATANEGSNSGKSASKISPVVRIK